MKHPRIARIEALQAKLDKREGVKGYEQNCDEMRTQIANLKKAHAEDLQRQQGYDL